MLGNMSADNVDNGKSLKKPRILKANIGHYDQHRIATLRKMGAICKISELGPLLVKTPLIFPRLQSTNFLETLLLKHQIWKSRVYFT